MADNNALKIFGFEIRRANKTEEDKKLQSIVPRQDDDGAGYVTASGSHYGQYINIDGDDSKDNHQMIMKYRGVSTHPEVDAAIEDIINESISASENEQAVKITLDKVEVSDQIKKELPKSSTMLFLCWTLPITATICLSVGTLMADYIITLL